MASMTKHGLPENWAQMTPNQRRQWRQTNFIEPQGVNFRQ